MSRASELGTWCSVISLLSKKNSMIKYEPISWRIAIYLIISSSRKEQTNLFNYSDIGIKKGRWQELEVELLKEIVELLKAIRIIGFISLITLGIMLGMLLGKSIH